MRGPSFIALSGVLCAVAGQAQIGASPEKASPEIVQQMRKEAAAARINAPGFTVFQHEVKMLRDTDADLLRRIAANTKKNFELKLLVDSLDITLDTRILTQHADAIKELLGREAHREDEAKVERDQARTFKTGSFMLLIGAALSGLGAIIKWSHFDPRRRSALQQKAEQHEANLLKVFEQMIALLKDETANSGSRRPRRAPVVADEKGASNG